MNNLNEAQQLAYSTNSKRVLVLAGAGTGKTHTMINRIHRIVSEESVNPQNILALTFTNAAAFEMRERYKNLSDNCECPTFQTFHAFCYSLISDDYRVRREIGYEAIPNIVDESEIKNLKIKVKTELGIKLSLGQLESSGDKLSLRDKSTYDMFHKAFAKQLKRSNIITFDMLINKVCKLFTSNHPTIQRYISKYHYIFIDEFQDTDPLQWEFAQCFKNSDLFIIGDALQSIYGFRGADSSIIKRIADDPDWEVIKLYENYRSTVQIVEYANDISKKNDDAYRVELKAYKQGLQVEEASDFRMNSIQPYEPNTFTTLERFCTSYPGSSAILVRTNKEVQQITDYLEDKQIEYSSNSEFSESKDILKSVIDSDYFLNWLMASMTQEQYVSILRLLAIDENAHPSVDDLLNVTICPPSVKVKAERVYKVMKLLSTDEFPFCKCEAVLEYLRITGITILPDGNSMLELAQYLLSEIDEIESKSLYVGTIHSSKGLEYDNVCVLGVGGPSFKLVTEEDNNLYYVAVTRARNRLLVIHGCT
ncbi:MAG: ATP-dependent helicase [Lachnospiraceae bacterium]|nr:ATP-dependent helicase [Lachnospiraceae bacterium]